MAHLTRCWCGRVYRCESSHTPAPFFRIFRRFSKQHDKCPDYLLHGPLKIEFTTLLGGGKFKEEELLAYRMPITKVIEDNSVKDLQEE